MKKLYTSFSIGKCLYRIILGATYNSHIGDMWVNKTRASADEVTPSVGSLDSRSSFWTKAVFASRSSESLRAKAGDRIYKSRFDRLKTNCNKSNQNRQTGCNGQYPPFHFYAISETLQPFLHDHPCNGRGNNDWYDDEPEKIFWQ